MPPTSIADGTIDDTPEEVVTCSRCGNPEDDCVCVMSLCCEEMFANESELCCGYCHVCISDGSVQHYHCSCGYESSFICDCCGRGLCCINQSSNETSLCDDCDTETDPDRDTDDIISDYGCKYYPVTEPSTNTVPMDYLYMGVEIEIECSRDISPEECAQEIYNEITRDKILITHDGSLEHGFEMITGKLGLHEQKTLWAKLAPIAIKAGARSWKHSTTGMHIHLSRRAFTPLTLAKLIIFINSENPATAGYITMIAGRNSEHYATKLKKTWASGLPCNLSENRYEAVNTTNSATIEIRIFKGTLNVEHIHANLEFSHAVYHWLIQESIEHCQDWSKFTMYLKKHSKEYPNILKYINRTKHPNSEKESNS